MPQYFKDKIKQEIFEYLSGYIVRKLINPDFFIDFEEGNLFSTEYLAGEEIDGLRSPFYKIASRRRVTTCYHISLYQFQFILKFILTRQSNFDGIVLHSSSVKFSNRVYIFLGQPGAGKSTTLSLLTEKDSRFEALGDDSSIIKKEGNKFIFYQSPFIERAHYIKKSGKGLMLDKVFFLRKSPFFRVKKMTEKEVILEELANNITTYSKENLNKQMPKVFDFVRNFPNFYILYFAKDGKKLIKLISELVT